MSGITHDIGSLRSVKPWFKQHMADEAERRRNTRVCHGCGCTFLASNPSMLVGKVACARCYTGTLYPIDITKKIDLGPFLRGEMVHGDG